MDPTRVTRTVVTVKHFFGWYGNDQLILRSRIQRNFVWKAPSRAYLIDTVLKNLPMPIVILRDQPGISLRPKLDVVDGQQRLTSIFAFITPEAFPDDYRFRLSAGQKKEYGVDNYAGLSDSIKQRLLDYEISTHILPSDTTDKTVLEIFTRLNATGRKLNAQELRNAKFDGYFKLFAYTVAVEYYDEWIVYGLFDRAAIYDMAEVEFVSDLALQILEGPSGLSQPRIDRLYADYNASFADEATCRKRFSAVMSYIQSHLSGLMEDSEFRKKTWFYALFGFLDGLLHGSPINAVPTVPKKLAPAYVAERLQLVSDLIRSGEVPEEIINTARTTHLSSRSSRLGFINSKFGG